MKSLELEVLEHDLNPEVWWGAAIIIELVLKSTQTLTIIKSFLVLKSTQILTIIKSF